MSKAPAKTPQAPPPAPSQTTAASTDLPGNVGAKQNIVQVALPNKSKDFRLK